MKILMLVSNPFTHDPRVYNEAKSLVKNGYNVTVIGWDKTGKNSESDNIDGINVIRSYNNWFMNILPYDIFKLHIWWHKGYRDALNFFKKQSFDVVHCHDLDTLPIGVKLKKKLGIPLFYDAHEIWGYMVARDLPRFWSKYYLKKEKKLVRHVDHIITVNEPLKDYFQSFTDKSISIIMNCKSLEEKTYNLPKNKKFTLIYIGSLSRARFLLELVDVVKDLPDVTCIIGGRGKSGYVKALKEKCSGIKNVDFIGVVPMADVVPMTKKADVVICMTSPDDPNNSLATANKQFEALVCGRPIICTKDTYPGVFTIKNDVGVVAKYTKEDLKEKITNLKNDRNLCVTLGKKALELAIDEYNWEKQEEKLVGLYEKIKG